MPARALESFFPKSNGRAGIGLAFGFASFGPSTLASFLSPRPGMGHALALGISGWLGPGSAHYAKAFRLVGGRAGLRGLHFLPLGKTMNRRCRVDSSK